MYSHRTQIVAPQSSRTTERDDAVALRNGSFA